MPPLRTETFIFIVVSPSLSLSTSPCKSYFCWTNLYRAPTSPQRIAQGVFAKITIATSVHKVQASAKCPSHKSPLSDTPPPQTDSIPIAFPEIAPLLNLPMVSQVRPRSACFQHFWPTLPRYEGFLHSSGISLCQVHVSPTSGGSKIPNLHSCTVPLKTYGRSSTKIDSKTQLHDCHKIDKCN